MTEVRFGFRKATLVTTVHSRERAWKESAIKKVISKDTITLVQGKELARRSS